MNIHPRQIDLEEWSSRYDELRLKGFNEPLYGGRLSRHLCDGDLRLRKLKFDNSLEALNLWNFLLTEEDRLRESRQAGNKLVGVMKDLGTVPVMAYSFPNLTAFYPDGAWWIPCVMELSDGLLNVADFLGIDESFCPVRAMLGAFETEEHFPIPDQLICSVGATCDDFSAIAQRLEGMGHPVLWWEMPHRRLPGDGEEAIGLPGGFNAPASQVDFVKSQLEMIKASLEKLAGIELTSGMFSQGIRKANEFRVKLAELRQLAFTAWICPVPALELLIAEMISLHFCSDQNEAIRVIDGLVSLVRARVAAGTGFFGPDAVKVFWVNPVADLQVMNLMEDCGGRLCGTEFLFSHALDIIPEDMAPLDALARMALADPMVGSGCDRAERICRDIKLYGSEAVIISRIPGASHCGLESGAIIDKVNALAGVPALEIEVPPVSDALHPTLKTRIKGLIETVRGNRKK